MLPNMLFINIGWMTDYKGPEESGTIGNHAHLKKNKTGFECYNFHPIDGYRYGYLPGHRFPDITNLGATRKEESVDGVLVVWMARNPTTNQTCIVGWYQNATVYNSKQDFPVFPQGDADAIWNYSVKAAVSDTKLLAPDKRTFVIPTYHDEEGGYGQSPMWYASKRPDIREKVFNYIKEKLSGYPITSHSWTILSDAVAEKKLDLSAFAHNGTGIPKEIVSFFDYSPEKGNVAVTLSYNNKAYSAHFAPDPKERTRLSWLSDFKDCLHSFFPKKNKSNGKMRLVKMASDTYQIELVQPSFKSIEKALAEDQKEDEKELEVAAPHLEKKQYSLHRKVDRNSKLIKEVKRHKGYCCEACGMSFTNIYGSIGDEFIEAHHLIPLSTLEANMSVQYDPIKDFAVLCSNCHRMIHKLDDPADLEGLRYLLKANVS